MNNIVVWYNPTKDTYYYKIIKCHYHENFDYLPGAVNSYGHVIIIIIPIDSTFYMNYKNKTFKDKVIYSMYTFLKKGVKRLEKKI